MSKADWFDTYYIVYTHDKGGIVDVNGCIIVDCIYDRAYSQNGYVVLALDGKWGLYSPWNGLIVNVQSE